MVITPRTPDDIPLIEFEYNCNSQKILLFISTERARSTDPGNTYLSRLPENYSNVSICPVVCHCVIGRYFNAFNVTDNKNNMWKYDLALETNWVTQRRYFRLVTKVTLGMGITDENSLFQYGISEKSREKKNPISEYNDRQFLNASSIHFYSIVVSQN